MEIRLHVVLRGRRALELRVLKLDAFCDEAYRSGSLTYGSQAMSKNARVWLDERPGKHCKTWAIGKWLEALAGYGSVQWLVRVGANQKGA